MKPIHEILKEKLENLEPKKTSRALAKEVGISPVYICQILSGEQLPPPATFVKIIQSLNFPTEQMPALFRRYKDKKYPELAEIDALFYKAYKEQSTKEASSKPKQPMTPEGLELTRKKIEIFSKELEEILHKHRKEIKKA